MSREPVAILKAEFWTVCRSDHLDLLIAGVHTGEEYSRTLLQIDL